MDSLIQVDKFLFLAQVRPDCADEVRQALLEAGLPRITVLRCADQGDSMPAEEELFRGQRVEPGLTPRVQVQVYVSRERLADAGRAVRAVEAGARCWALPLLDVPA
jgi:nitrogen regulatory protein PII